MPGVNARPQSVTNCLSRPSDVGKPEPMLKAVKPQMAVPYDTCDCDSLEKLGNYYAMESNNGLQCTLAQ